MSDMGDIFREMMRKWDECMALVEREFPGDLVGRLINDLEVDGVQWSSPKMVRAFSDEISGILRKSATARQWPLRKPTAGDSHED